MDQINFLNVGIRWIHIFSAIAAGGGAMFMLMALRPAAAQLDEQNRTALLEHVRKGFVKVVMISILGLIVSGFYNYLVVFRPKHEGQPLYHALMGVKILLALIIFFLSSALTGRAKAFNKLRENAGMWLTINVVLIAIVVLLGAILKAIPESVATV